MPERPLEDIFNSVVAGSHGAMATRDPGRITAFARRLHVIADGYIAERRAEVEVELACRLGCDACCHRIVEATLPEVLAATSFVIATFSDDQRQGLLDRIDGLATLNQDFWNNRSDLANAACPFLVDHACSIYEARPLSCRALNSEDAGACQSAYLKGEDVRVPQDLIQVQVGSLDRAVMAGSKEVGAVSGSYELGPTVATLLREPGQAYDLVGFQPKLERTKLWSEWNTEEESKTDFVWRLAADPLVKKVREAFLRGDARETVAQLAKRKDGPFETIFRLAMPHEYRTQDELEEWWAHWLTALDHLESTDLPPQETFEVIELYNAFSVAYAGKNVRPGMQRFMGVLNACASRAYPQLTAPFESARKPGRFRLGYISPRVKNFNGSRWALGWLTRHCPEIETYVINLVGKEDQVSTRFRRAADFYFHAPFPVPRAAALIRELDLDALIFTDVGMDGQSLQLASLRLARTQLNSWGHPVTSGSPTMDYYLSSELMEPDGGQDHYSEQLVRLPGSGLSYPRTPLRPSSKSASELGVPEGGFLFFCQLSFKQIPKFDGIFREILDRSKKPVVFLGSPVAHGQPILRERMEHPNAIFLPYLPAQDYLRLLQLAEVSLDTPAWNGGNTTIEALALGTPVVSMAGEFMRGRHALALLPLANVGGLIAKDGQDYVDLVLNEERRNQIMLGLDVDPLYEDPRPVEAIDRLLLA